MQQFRTSAARPGRSCSGHAVVAAAMLAAAALPAAAAERDRAGVQVWRGAEQTVPIIPFVFEGDLRELPVSPGWLPGDAIKEIPRRHTRPALTDVPPPEPRLDPLLALQEEADRARGKGGALEMGMLEEVVNFAGQGFSGVQPPDTVGDVGPNHYIQMINAASGANFVIYNKTGTILAGPTTLDSLGAGFCANGLGDPIVLYDRLADRWLLSEFSSSGNRLCVYVSQGPNPVTDGWFNYDFTAPSFPDYPKYAVWPDAYYVGSNETSPALYALERTAMLAGSAASVQRMTVSGLSGFAFQMVIPADLDGATAPPGGTPGYFLRHNDDEVHGPPGGNPNADFVQLFEYEVDFDNPGMSSVTGPFQIAVSEFDSHLCGLVSFNCFPQPGTGVTLDPLREVVMWRAQYRNTGEHETLVGSFVTDVDGTDHGGVRWFELRDTGGGFGLFQEGTYAPDGHNRFMSSAAMDGSGNLAVGYNITSSTQSPSLRYAARQAGDTLGTLPSGEEIAAAGSGSNSSNRYGDYSSMNVDPADDCTFWLTGEYNPSSLWATRIESFKFSDCGEEPPVEEFTLDEPVPGIAGRSNTWAAANATAMGRVIFFRGQNPGTTPLSVGGCGVLSLDIANARFLGQAQANGAGDAAVTRNVPLSQRNRTRFFQAVDRASCTVSNLVSFTWQ